MAAAGAIRNALIKLMGAKEANKAAGPTIPPGFHPEAGFDRMGQRPFDSMSPGMREATIQAEGKFGADEALRGARRQVKEVQGNDPLQVPIGPARTGLKVRNDNLEGVGFHSGRKDPSRLPDGPAAGEVPGSNEAITLFEQLMDAVEGGTDPLTLGPQLTRLRQIAPEFFLSVSDTIKQKKRVNPSIAQDIDDIPF